MHNTKDLRKNLDKFKKKFLDRNFKFDIKLFEKLDNTNRELISKKEKLEQEKKKLSKIVKHKLDTLPSNIPEIIKYETAINIGSYGASFYDVSLISVFKNEDDFWKYTKYPIHDEVVDFIKSVQESEQIVDYIKN